MSVMSYLDDITKTAVLPFLRTGGEVGMKPWMYYLLHFIASMVLATAIIIVVYGIYTMIKVK